MYTQLYRINNANLLTGRDILRSQRSREISIDTATALYLELLSHNFNTTTL